jgi:very-short-patch-repair endonuclease
VQPEVRQGEEQSAWAAMLNAQLRNDGFALVQAGVISTYPVFKLQPVTVGVAGVPKNIIFASSGPKPEIGFKDAINNEIVILKHEASCLIFDEAIPRDGLLWEDMVQWWARKHGLYPTEEATRRHLGQRLMASLSSEPEKQLFSTYFSAFRHLLGSRLPALIPQVYLHYDPKTLAELAGQRRLIRQHMDFLLLLPNQIRVVIEVDGEQHYADHKGHASPRAYADMVRADRGLRLLGYEVYRFGGFELQRKQGGEQIIKDFFEKLFAKYNFSPFAPSISHFLNFKLPVE